MGKFDGMLICTDFDMTLGRGGVVSEENLAAIRYFQENGGRFTVISGRAPNFTYEHVPIDFCAPVSGYNGALLYTDGGKRCLHRGGCSDFSFLDLLAALWERDPNVAYVIVHAADGSGVLTRGVHPGATVYRSTAELRAGVHLPILNAIVVAYTEEYAKRLLHEIPQLCPHVEAVRSWSVGVEVIFSGDDKGSAALRIRQATGAKRLICVGDFENDISMIRVADIGYAVENALPEVQAAADRVTVSWDRHAIAAIMRDLET